MFLCRVLFNVRKPEANQTGFGLTPRTRHWTEPAGTNAPRTRFKAQWSVSTQLPLSGIIITTHVSRRNGLLQHISPCPALPSPHTRFKAQWSVSTHLPLSGIIIATHVSRRNGLLQHISLCPALPSPHTRFKAQRFVSTPFPCPALPSFHTRTAEGWLTSPV